LPSFCEKEVFQKRSIDRKGLKTNNLPYKMAKKALVLSGGSLRGAFQGGATSVLIEKLGPTHFDKIFASSVGTCHAPYYPANQSSELRDIWYNHVGGGKLINWGNAFRRGKNILDLEYLMNVFQNGQTRLDTDSAFSNGVAMTFTVTNKSTGEVEYMVPDANNVFLLMTASCSLPIGHSPVNINGGSYIDGSISDYTPVFKALEEGHEEVVVITNSPLSYRGNKIANVLKTAKLGRKRGRNMEAQKRGTNLVSEWDDRVKVIQPSEVLPVRYYWSDEISKLRDTFDIGLNAAERFLETYN
jgi:predicted patatin/cPLA2 family phospholipase